MITILAFLLFFLFLKFLMEESLLVVLMTMEAVSMCVFFLILSLNPEALSLSPCVISFLSIHISESVLSLGIFVSLVRFSNLEKIGVFSH